MIFLSLDEVLSLHADQIHRYGGTIEIRDMRLLESALAMPQASFEGALLHSSVFEMAAAYLFHIVQNHPFVDGNKRAGLATAIVFLGLNGYSLIADEDSLVRVVLATATSETSKAELAVFLMENCKRTDG